MAPVPTIGPPRRRRPGRIAQHRPRRHGRRRTACCSRARPAAAWTSSSTTRGARRPRWAATPGSRPARWTAPLVDARGDVLTYTTPPLGRDLHLAGDVTATLDATADAASFDLHAILSELPASGGVFELASGYCRANGLARISLRGVLRARSGRQPFAPVGCRRRLPGLSGQRRHRPAARRGAPDRPADHHHRASPRRLGAPFANLTKTARGPYGSRNKGLEPRTSSQALLAMTWWFERWQCRAHGRGPSHHFAAASRLAAASLNTRSSTLARRPRSLARAR